MTIVEIYHLITEIASEEIDESEVMDKALQIFELKMKIANLILKHEWTEDEFEEVEKAQKEAETAVQAFKIKYLQGRSDLEIFSELGNS